MAPLTLLQNAIGVNRKTFAKYCMTGAFRPLTFCPKITYEPDTYTIGVCGDLHLGEAATGNKFLGF